MLTFFTSLFDIYNVILLLRIILHWIRADYYHPISQLILKLTNPIINPIKRILPAVKKFDLASLLLAIILSSIKLFILLQLFLPAKTPVYSYYLLSIILGSLDLLKLSCSIFFYAILLQAILSWLNQGYHPTNLVLEKITAPILQPFRRIIPLVAGFDLAPIPAMLLLQFTKIVIESLSTLVISLLS